MNIPLVDYHCHLDLYPDFEKLIAECEKKEIYTLTVTTTPRAWPKNLALTKNLKFVRPALGLHPQLVINLLKNSLKFSVILLNYVVTLAIRF